jgi:GDPmannose 4,6-dehydratase
VTRKITSGLALIKHGKSDVLEMGNLEATRDWGFAGDYVEGMWLMLQASAPADYVLATGESNSVRRFIELAASTFDFDLEWRGRGEAEIGVDRNSGRVLVRIDKRDVRPPEVSRLVGRPDKARQQLGWHCRVKLNELVALMAEADDRRVRDGSVMI